MTATDARNLRYVVARAADIPEGGRLIVDILGRSVGIFNVGGDFHAILNRCPHKGAELCKGDIIGLVQSSRPGDVRLDKSQTLIVCPWHGWEYDLLGGQSYISAERTRARPFPLSVESGDTVAAEVDSGTAAAPAEGNARFIDPETHRVAGPYRAEVLPVSVEDDYLVISLRVNSPARNQEEVRDAS